MDLYGGLDLSQLSAKAPAETTKDFPVAATGSASKSPDAAQNVSSPSPHPSAEGMVKGGTSDSSLIPGPFVREASEEDFDSIVELSTQVPVILNLMAPEFEACQKLTALLSEIANELQGKIQLVNIDVQSNQMVAQAFQASSVPLVVAFLAGQPTPLFQGLAEKEGIVQLFQRVLEAAAQGGIIGVMSGEENPEPPLSPQQAEIKALLEAEDYDQAYEAAKLALINDPANATEYQILLDKLGLQKRLVTASEKAQKGQAFGEVTPEAPTDPLLLADQFFASGNEPQAYAILLDEIAKHQGEERDPYRERLLELLRLGHDPAVVHAVRTKLANLLF